MRHVDIIPDWVMLALVMFVMAGAFSNFAGFCVLVLAVVCVAGWVIQTLRRS
jgi:hypothetical protein